MPLEDRFNWYVGAGAGFGLYNSSVDDGTFALLAGDLGIEYNFKIPLLLSLDIRPEFGLSDTYNDDLDLALGITYQF